MDRVAVELGPLAGGQRGLAGPRGQTALRAQQGEVVVVGIEQVEPDGDGLITQVVADVGDREALTLELAVPIQPRARLTPGRADLTDRRLGRRPHLPPPRACEWREAGRR